MEPTASPSTGLDSELLPGTDVGGYVIETKLGEGGMGIVYGARHPRIGKRAAIKVLAQQFCRDPATVQRFEQEARLVNEIHHPNIVDIFQFGDLPDGRKYLAMEWLEGESLSDRIDRGPIPPAEAVWILEGVCDALQAVHETGIVHRDLKSDNIFLANARGYAGIKLLDFGLAKLAANDPRAVFKTKTGIVVGTPHYMSPEQIRGRPADHRTDVYALGVLAFKMLAGQLPFSGSPTDLLVHHLKTAPPSLGSMMPGIPDALAQIVTRMMAKEPDQRPTVPELRQAFAALRAPSSTANVPVAAAPPPASRAKYIALGAVLLVLAGTISFLLVSLATQT